MLHSIGQLCLSLDFTLSDLASRIKIVLSIGFVKLGMKKTIYERKKSFFNKILKQHLQVLAYIHSS